MPGTEPSPESLRGRFGPWLNVAEDAPLDVSDSTIISVDANVLLSLYELSSNARDEALAALRAVRSQLWLTHQAGLEFARNRERVVTDRARLFSSARREMNDAQSRAAQTLSKAASRVDEVRTKARSARPWQQADSGLTEKALRESLSNTLDAARTEIDALEAEHGITVRDVKGQDDELLVEIDRLIGGAIGATPSSDQLRKLVKEAVEFRYPNRIPPGHMDSEKPTELLAAGDYLLWSQVLEEARRQDATSVILVTRDIKDDWWEVTENGRPLRALPELIDEMSRTSGSKFHLLTFESFLDLARELGVSVSDDTVQEVRENEFYPFLANEVDFYALSLAEFEDLVGTLFRRMGYDILQSESSGARYRPDFILGQQEALFDLQTVVEVKRYKGPVGADIVHQVLGMRAESGCDFAIIVSSSYFTSSAKQLAQRMGVRLINGEELQELLAQYDVNKDPDSDDEN